MLLRAAESHTTPNEAGKAGQAQNWGGAQLRLIKPPTSNIKPFPTFFMSTFLEPQISNKHFLAKLKMRENLSEPLVVRLTPRLMNQLNAVCKQTGAERSVVVRAFIEHGLDFLQDDFLQEAHD